MFSRRTRWDLRASMFAQVVERRRRSGAPLLDLTSSNPTRVGIPYPAAEIAGALTAGPCHAYEPHALGAPEAREAVARWYARRGLRVEAEQVVITASTSEAYAWLFKLLCDPGDRVLVPRPSYPLFEFLAGLESVTLEHYLLRCEGRWRLDGDALAGAAATPAPPEAEGRSAAGDAVGPGETSGKIGALVVVNPNNPTGSYLSRDDLESVLSVAGRLAVPIVSDEVFSSYALEADRSPSPLVVSLAGLETPPASFVLDGLSKGSGMPGMKCGWIVVLGPAEFRSEALARLELIADTYLSVSAPVQFGLARLLEIGETIAALVRERVRANLAALRGALARHPAFEAPIVEGGWSAILRVPQVMSEDAWCLALLEEDDVLVQPGWFFDFEGEARLVISLLTPPEDFSEGLRRILVRAG